MHYFSRCTGVVILIVFNLCAAADDVAKPPATSPLRMNQVQVIGTHNSYHMHRDDMAFKLLSAVDSRVNGWNYTHAPLDAQLDRGVRSLELDLHNYPDCYHVFHVPRYDDKSSCPIFTDCLTVIKEWSKKHPRHVPISILMEIKEAEDVLAPVHVAPIDADALDRLDAEIRSVFQPNQLITPDDVRLARLDVPPPSPPVNPAITLAEAVTTHGWPTLDAARGRVFFILHQEEPNRGIYTKDHPSLEGRAMFVRSEEGRKDAATFVMDNPNDARIPELIKKGFYIRTRAGDPAETARHEKALASGAQIVSTDNPAGEPDPKTGHVMELPNKKPVRCNPVNTTSNCTDETLVE